jgi:hypothetical protein
VEPIGRSLRSGRKCDTSATPRSASGRRLPWNIPYAQGEPDVVEGIETGPSMRRCVLQGRR